jgi:aryl-alcohol dehydrogenase-like predicted oxidoreductase
VTELRRVGSSDLRVSSLCLGGNVFGWTADQAQSFAVLDAYLAAGGNFVDTADSYMKYFPEQGNFVITAPSLEGTLAPTRE